MITKFRKETEKKKLLKVKPEEISGPGKREDLPKPKDKVNKDLINKAKY